MNKIICPHCKSSFELDEAGFADILKQIHDQEFANEIQERVKLLEKECYIKARKNINF